MNPYRAFPKSLRIGALKFRIEVRSLRTEPEGNWGLYEYDKQLIELDEAPPSAEFAVDTVLHELTHAIYGCSGLKPGDDEERVVSVFATWLTMLLRDNPDLLGWLRVQLAPRKSAKSV